MQTPYLNVHKIVNESENDAKVVETSVNINAKSLSRDCTSKNMQRYFKPQNIRFINDLLMYFAQCTFFFRLEEQESSFSDELQVRLAKWRQEYEVTMLWCEEEKMKLEEMEKDQDEIGYDRVYESKKILEVPTPVLSFMIIKVWH